MDFQQYRETIARLQSSRWTPRQKRLNALSRVLKGKQYEHIRAPFSQEKDGDPISGKRILLDDRRPAAKAGLPKQLVRDQCGLIFGEDHRPLIIAKGKTRDTATCDWITAFVHDTEFWLVLMDALWKGSVGSSVIVLRVLGETKDVIADGNDGDSIVRREPDGPGRYHFEVWSGEECSPVFKRSAPEELEKLDRRYFIGEDALRAQGYDIDKLKAEWDKRSKGWRAAARKGLSSPEWTLRIMLDAKSETWYLPIPRYAYERPDWTDAQWQVDPDRTFEHEIGEVPAQWVRPLPLDADEYYPDGACIFEDVIDFEYRINRTGSQVGRAFDYAGDPQMARARGDKGGVSQSTFGMPLALGGTASDVIEVEAGGEAKFVEISGKGLQVAIEAYLSCMNDLAKAAGAMSRVTPNSKTGAAPDLSSLAMKMLNYAQLILSGILRETAAEKPGNRMLRLAMRLWGDLDVELPSLVADVMPDATARFEWQWPDYYEPHGQEKLFEVQSVAAAMLARTMSQETGVANVGPMFDVQSPDDEIERIQGDEANQLVADVARATEMGKAQANTAPKTEQSGENPT